MKGNPIEIYISFNSFLNVTNSFKLKLKCCCSRLQEESDSRWQNFECAVRFQVGVFCYKVTFPCMRFFLSFLLLLSSVKETLEQIELSHFQVVRRRCSRCFYRQRRKQNPGCQERRCCLLSCSHIRADYFWKESIASFHSCIRRYVLRHCTVRRQWAPKSIVPQYKRPEKMCAFVSQRKMEWAGNRTPQTLLQAFIVSLGSCSVASVI